MGGLVLRHEILHFLFLMCHDLLPFLLLSTGFCTVCLLIRHDFLHHIRPLFILPTWEMDNFWMIVANGLVEGIVGGTRRSWRDVRGHGVGRGD